MIRLCKKGNVNMIDIKKIGRDDFITFIIPYLFLVTLIIALTFPRIAIINSDPIIRIDDILILFSSIVLILFGKCKEDNTWKYLFPFLFVCLVSISLNYINGDNNVFRGIIYLIRLIEYYMLYLIACNIKNNHIKYIINSVKICLIINLIIIVIQIIGPRINLLIFNTELSNVRPYGLFRWTYEAAIYSGITAIYFFFKKEYKFVFISLMIIILTQSRSQLLAIILCVFISLFKNISVKKLLVLTFVIIIGSIIILNRNLDVYISDLFFKFNLLQINNSFNAYDSKEFYLLNYGEMTNYRLPLFDYVDHSWALRFLHWVNAIYSISGDKFELLFGRGPSFFGVALDGQFIRIISENGLFGLFTFTFFVVQIYCSNQTTIRTILIFMLFSSIFIDVFYSYKVMVIFYSILAFEKRLLEKSLQ